MLTDFYSFQISKASCEDNGCIQVVLKFCQVKGGIQELQSALLPSLLPSLCYVNCTGSLDGGGGHAASVLRPSQAECLVAGVQQCIL